MLEREYKDFMEQIAPCPALREQTVRRMTESGRPAPAKVKNFRRITVVAAVWILAAALSVTALATAFPGFREMLFDPHSILADSLTPIAAQGEQDGMRIEVLGAMGDGNNLTVYFTLQDTLGENRLSGDMNVISSAKLNGEYPPDEDVATSGVENHTAVLEYKEDTQTALCRFEMTTGEYDGTPYDAANAQVRLQIKKIAVTQDKLDYMPLEISAEDLTTETLPVARVHCDEYGPDGELLAENFQTLEEAEAQHAEYAAWHEERGETWPSLFAYRRDEAGIPAVLKPGEGVRLGGRDYAQITAIGFLDGKLHIQYKDYGYRQDGVNQGIEIGCVRADEWETVAAKLNASAQEKRRLSAEEWDLKTYKQLSLGYFDLGEDGQVQWGAAPHVDFRYSEDVFDVDPEELEEYEFFAVGMRRTSTTMKLFSEFTLDESLPQTTVSFGPIKMENTAIQKLDVTPMGVYLAGSRECIGGIKKLELICDGEPYPYEIIHTDGILQLWDDTISSKYIAVSAPVDPEKITALRIDGEEIALD